MDAVEKGAVQTMTKPEIRLVDGPTPTLGRLQIFHAGEWRSVCTNSRK